MHYIRNIDMANMPHSVPTQRFGANILAREWCRKGHFYFSAWINSIGLEKSSDPAAHVYVESMEFLGWALEVDVSSKTWGKVMELRNARPVLTAKTVHCRFVLAVCFHECLLWGLWIREGV